MSAKIVQIDPNTAEFRTSTDVPQGRANVNTNVFTTAAGVVTNYSIVFSRRKANRLAGFNLKLT